MAEDAVSNQHEHNSNPETNTPILDEEQQQQPGGAPTTQPNPNPNPTRSHPEPLSLQLPASRWPSSAGRPVSDAAEGAQPPLQTAAPSQPPHPHPAVGHQGPVVLSTEEVPLTLPVPPAAPPPQSLLSADVGEPQGSQLLPAAAQLVVDMDEREDLGDLGQLGQMDGFDDDDNDIKIKQQQQQQQQQIRDDGANARSGGVGGGGNRAGGGASRLPGAPPGGNGGARSGGGAVPERAELLRRVFARYAVAPGQGRLVTDADFAEPRMSASTFQRAITELGLMAPTGPLTPESVGALFAKCKPPGNRKMNAAHFQQAMALLEEEAGGSVDVGAAAAAMAARLRQQKQQQGRPQQQQQGRGQGQQRSESEGAATRLPRLPPPPAPPPGRIRHSMNGSPPPKYAQERKQSDPVLAGRGGSGPVRNASSFPGPQQYDPAGEAAGGGGVPRGALAPMVPPPRLAFVAAPGGGGGGPDAGAATDAAIALRNLNIKRSLTGIATLPQGYAILAAQSSAPQETPAPARLTALPSANSAAAAPLPHGAADPPGSLQSLSVRVSALEQQSQDLKSRLAAERLEILQRVADLASLTATAAKNAQQTPHSSTTTAATASGVSTNAVRSADDEVAAQAAANAVGVAHRAADGAAAARRAADEATAAATSAAEALEMLVARMEAVEATAAAEAGVRRRLEEEVARLRARTGGMRTGSQMGFVGGEEDGEGQGGDDPARRRRQKFLEAEIATLRARVDEESAGRIRLREEVQLLRLKVEDEALQRSRLKEELNVQRARAEEVAQQQLQQLQIQLQQQQQLEVQQQHQLQQLQQQLQQVQQVQLMQQQRRTTGSEEDSSQQRQRLGDEVQMQKTRLEDEATQRVRLREEVSQLRIWLEEESRQRQLLATDVAQRLLAVDGCRNDVRRLEESVANIVAGALMAQLEPRVEQMVGRMMMMTQQGRAAGTPQVNVATPLDGKPTGADEATHGLVGTGWAQRVAALEMTMQAAETGSAAARAAAEAAQARVEALAAEWAEVTSSATHSVMAKSVASASNAGLLALQTRVAQLVAAAEDQAARLQQLHEQIREGSPAAVAAATAAAVAASEARVVAATTAAATANDTARGAASEAATARLSAEVARAVAARAEAAVEALAARVEQQGVWQDNAGSKTSDPGPQTNPSDPAADADAWPEFEPASAEGSLASTAGGATPATNVVLSTSAAMDAAETAGLLADVASISRDQAELLEALQARITALETAGAAYNSARQLQQAVLDEHTAEMQQLKAAVNLLQHQQAAAASASIAAGIGRLVSISGAGDEAPAGGGGGDVGYKLRKQLSEAQAEVQRFKEMLDKLGGRVEVLEAERRERRHSGTSGAEGAAAAAPSDGDGDGAGGSDAEGQKAATKESARALVEAAEQRLRNELEAAVQAVVNHEVSELRPLITRLDALEKQQQQRQGAEGAAGSAGDSPAGPQSDSSAAKPSTSPEASGTGEVTPSEFAAVRASVDELSQSVKRLDGVTTDLNEDMQFAARDVGRMLVQVRQLQQLYVALAESTGVKPPGPVVFPPAGAEGGPAGDPSGAAAAPESVAPAAAAGPGAPPPGAEKAGAGPEDAANGGVPSEGRQGPPPAQAA